MMVLLVDAYCEMWYHQAMKHDEELEQFWNDYVQSHPHLQEQSYFEAFRFGNTEKMANELQECALIDRQATVEMPLVCERFQVVYKR